MLDLSKTIIFKKYPLFVLYTLGHKILLDILSIAIYIAIAIALARTLGGRGLEEIIIQIGPV